MIILKGTTETLEVVTTTTEQLDITVTFSNQGGTFDTYQTTVAAAATTPIVQASSYGHINKLIEIISIVNIGTGSNTAKIQKDVSGTNYVITPAIVLLAGESAYYTRENGWIVYDAQGLKKKV